MLVFIRIKLIHVDFHKNVTRQEGKPNNKAKVGITDGHWVLSRCLVNPSHQIMSLGAEVGIGFKIEGGDVVASILVTLHHPPYLEEACCCLRRELLASSSWS